jgi:hypothetical protein
MSCKDKDAQLGMPLGTASGKLRKQILFHLLCKLNENICFKCKKPILNVDELSIEHKENWLHSENPKELFFSLDNIAFSHMKCNLPERRFGGFHKRIKCKEGYSFCSKCKKMKKMEEFHKCNRRWNGVNGHCKECVSNRY